MNECDFCNAESEHLYPINDGLWAVCKPCMDINEMLPSILSKVVTDPPPQPELTRRTEDSWPTVGEEE